MNGFKFVPTGNFDKHIQTGHCICETCGVKVETGVVNLVTHWKDCCGKGITEKLIQARKEKGFALIIEDLPKIYKK